MVEAMISLIRLSEYWASLLPKLDEFRNGVDETNPEMQHLARYLKLNETPLQNGETLPTRARRNLEAQVGIDKKTMDKYSKRSSIGGYVKAHGVFTLIANTDHRNVIKDSPTLHVASLALWEDELPASHTARPMPCRRLS